VIVGSLAARIGKDDRTAKEFRGPLAAKLDATAWPYPIVLYLSAVGLPGDHGVRAKKEGPARLG
jgi:hypothetical protein